MRLQIVEKYAKAFKWINAYNANSFPEPDESDTPGIMLTASKAISEVVDFKDWLLVTGNDIPRLFGQERKSGALATVFSKVNQTIFGTPAYLTIYTKAANLLYLIIKEQPFATGNKEIGSFLFVEFLCRNKRLYTNNCELRIPDRCLSAITLLVAESDKCNREAVINFIIQMLISCDYNNKPTCAKQKE